MITWRCGSGGGDGGSRLDHNNSLSTVVYRLFKGPQIYTHTRDVLHVDGSM